MNRLPWFTHDHNAHLDPEIRELIRKEGHAAHTIYWTLIECLHMHGKGDRLKMSVSDFAHASMSTTIKVRVVLTILGSIGKVQGTWSGDHLEIEIKKFRERQSNLKIKTISRPFQDHSKTTIEREGEGDRENNLPQAVQKPGHSSPKKLTPVQMVIRGFKEAKGVDCEDAEWDVKFFSRNLRAAHEVLTAFDGDAKRAIDYILIKSVEWSHLSDWGLEAIIKSAGREYNKINGGMNGHEHKQVGADSLDGRKRDRGTSSSREIAGDALKAIEKAGICRKESPDVASDLQHRSDDDADFS